MNLQLPPRSLVRVERFALRGPGVVILTGPSSCGKGEVAAALCDLVSIDPARHLSMGEILRSTIERAKDDWLQRRHVTVRWSDVGRSKR